VRSSRALKYSVLLLLIGLTLGWKWAVISYGGGSDPGEPEDKVAAREVAAFLARNHFSVVEPREFVFGMQLLEAAAGLCRMRVTLSSSRGWHRDHGRDKP
jgi:hypothetical protein